jgi:dTDP-4-amino-4,6-dideoxygalactose transaminase
MTDIHAAIGRVQLTKLARWTAQRRSNAKFLDQNLKNVVIPFVAPNAIHVYHQYTIRIPGHSRDAFADEMTKRGVGNGVYYPIPVHELASFGLKLELPETTRASKEVLSIPVHPSLSQGELETIVSVINSIAGAGA